MMARVSLGPDPLTSSPTRVTYLPGYLIYPGRNQKPEKGYSGRERKAVSQSKKKRAYVEEARLDVCGLLQHDEIPSSPLSRRNLRGEECI